MKEKRGCDSDVPSSWLYWAQLGGGSTKHLVGFHIEKSIQLQIQRTRGAVWEKRRWSRKCRKLERETKKSLFRRKQKTQHTSGLVSILDLSLNLARHLFEGILKHRNKFTFAGPALSRRSLWGRLFVFFFSPTINFASRHHLMYFPRVHVRRDCVFMQVT